MPRRKPPASNRTIPIKDRKALGLSGPQVAWLVVRDMLRWPEDDPLPTRPVGSVDGVVEALKGGTPIVLTATLPSQTAVTGYLLWNGHARKQTVTLVSYSKTRDAVRLTPSRGAAFGQGGRAWLPVADLKKVFAADDASAYAPDPPH